MNIIRAILFLVYAAVLSACLATNQVKPDIPVVPENPTTEEPANPVGRIPLYWENTVNNTEPHPERIPWSDVLNANNSELLSKYGEADDITEICPKYHSLSKEDKVKAVGELFVAMAYHESAFKPATTYKECSKLYCQYVTSGGCSWSAENGFCMKGGHKLDGGIVISRGLLQISLQSAQGNKCDVHVPQDLHDPEKNLICGTKIMDRQIDRTGKIMTSSNYWAVIKPTSKYNQISDIKSRVLKYAPKCK